MDEIFRLLVVEDTPIAQMIVKLHMSTKECEVDIAADGASALEKTKRIQYDLILMDIGLGEGKPNGFEVTLQIKKEVKINAKTPVIALSAHSGAEYREQALAAGMERYFTKPFGPNHAKEIMEYLKKKQIAYS